MDFHYTPLYQLGNDHTPYHLLTKDHVEAVDAAGRRFVIVAPEGLRLVAREAMKDCAFFLREAHLDQLAVILDAPEASDNDRYVAAALLKNAAVAAGQQLPSCQDTGTAIVYAHKGEQVWTMAEDKKHLSHGIFDAYTRENLRYSQIAPLSMYEEVNTNCNLPAQIDIHACQGDEYHFLFLAKGGGSANKTFLFQETKSLLNETNLLRFCREKVPLLGTTACPPYHIALVIGGTSAEANLKAVKLASAGYFDLLPTSGSRMGRAFRDLEWEARLLEIAQETGLGAQFGGKYLAHDVRVIRLPRHAASNPVGLGVSCSAHRNIKAKITSDGIFLETLVKDMSRYQDRLTSPSHEAVSINLDQPMVSILQELAKHPAGTLLHLNGTMIVARDIAHARLYQLISEGQPLPDYCKKHPVYYAGPAKTPPGYPSGSFGPTTAGRMDIYVEVFQALGGSMIMVAKGNRSQAVTDSCRLHGGFYLGSIGGPAAVLAQESISQVEVIDFADLGMEAVHKIRVRNFPAFIICDDKGNDLYQSLTGRGNDLVIR
ncbi:MAG: FumA C-terminus/TtdB family hydratase beta subunit [Proteobacteria bacterium]|nr:FumA C-terminus/TtdB family hydratase beta subunit [Pseudomonadota bacterium]MDP2104802.1 FumA C-terminus/TtdB family hydratase beta subunit [Desulfobulbaceae bacterium]